MLNSTQNLKYDHTFVRRLGQIAETCSQKLYEDKDIPMEDLQIISVIMEEFVDRFHHGKEEQSYFPKTKDKNGFSDDIRKFLIEHELGRRIANMFRKELKELRNNIENSPGSETGTNNFRHIKEPVARFLKAYSVFIRDHTGKEDKFFDLIENNHSISKEEDTKIRKHYENCKSQLGGEMRIQKMIELLEYLENRDWIQK
jgi:hemerythrin-like domain-containing protein